MAALFTATALLFVRTVFRSVELSEGFGGKLANNQIEFMILDGVMVILASVCLTIWNPGFGFDGRWNEAEFPFAAKKDKVDQEDQHSPASGSNDQVEPAILEKKL